jgi:tripartite-type tricarboxylate transporter receptor subunit TctC
LGRRAGKGNEPVIENQPGANGIIATEAVVRAPADGYTLLMVNSSLTINATLYEKLNFVFVRDIAPVASVLSVPNLMMVHPLFPARSVPEFISYAKANPGKVNYGSSGNRKAARTGGHHIEAYRASTRVADCG